MVDGVSENERPIILSVGGIPFILSIVAVIVGNIMLKSSDKHEDADAPKGKVPASPKPAGIGGQCHVTRATSGEI